MIVFTGDKSNDFCCCCFTHWFDLRFFVVTKCFIEHWFFLLTFVFCYQMFSYTLIVWQPIFTSYRRVLFFVTTDLTYIFFVLPNVLKHWFCLTYTLIFVIKCLQFSWTLIVWLPIFTSYRRVLFLLTKLLVSTLFSTWSRLFFFHYTTRAKTVFVFLLQNFSYDSTCRCQIVFLIVSESSSSCIFIF